MTGRALTAGVAASAVILFAVTGLAVDSGWTDGADRAALLAIQSLQSASPAGFTEVMRLITHVGDFVVRVPLAAAAGAWLWWRGERRAAIALIIAVLAGAAIVETVLKPSFDRLRPDIVTALAPTTSTSFPSGHAAGGALVFGFGGYLLGQFAGRTWFWAGTLLAALIGFSRLWLAVHWPSDVVAGWLLALAIAGVALALADEPSAREAVSAPPGRRE